MKKYFRKIRAELVNFGQQSSTKEKLEQEINKLISEKKDLNEKATLPGFEKDTLPIFAACYYGLKDSIYKLAKAGADVNAIRKGLPVLMWAIYYDNNNNNTAIELIKAGADVNYKTKDWEYFFENPPYPEDSIICDENATALTVALRFGAPKNKFNKDIVEELLKAGANPNIISISYIYEDNVFGHGVKRDGRRTALFMANVDVKRYGNTEYGKDAKFVQSLLIEHGAKTLDEIDSYNENNQEKIYQDLAKFISDGSIKDFDEYVAENNVQLKYEQLGARLFDLVIKKLDYKFAEHLFSIGVKAFEYLIPEKGEGKSSDVKRYIPIEVYAFRKNDLEFCKLLMDHDYYNSDHDGIDVLKLACARSSAKVVAFILDHYKKAEKALNYVTHLKGERAKKYPEYDQLTPLMIAASLGKLEVCRTLIEGFGANPFWENKQRKNAYDLAEERGHTETASYIGKVMDKVKDSEYFTRFRKYFGLKPYGKHE